MAASNVGGVGQTNPFYPQPVTTGTGPTGSIDWSKFIGSLGGLQTASSGSFTTPTVNPGAPQPTISPIDMTASNAATFANAKDTAGQIGRSEFDSMQGLLGAAGQLGGGAQVAGTRDIVENAAGQLGAVNRQNAMNTAATNLDVAKTNQGAGITQRGQDIAAQEANASLAQQQAQLSFQNSMFQSNQQLELLKAALGFAGNIVGGGVGGIY